MAKYIYLLGHTAAIPAAGCDSATKSCSKCHPVSQNSRGLIGQWSNRVEREQTEPDGFMKAAPTRKKVGHVEEAKGVGKEDGEERTIREPPLGWSLTPQDDKDSWSLQKTLSARNPQHYAHSQRRSNTHAAASTNSHTHTHTIQQTLPH